MKKFELFAYTSSVLLLIYFENATSTSYTTNGGRFGYGSREGKGLGLKGQSCTLQIVESSRSADEKKNRISAEKLLNNINNCWNGVQTKVEKQAPSMDRT